MGNEQDYHFKVLFLILKKLGFPWADELFHLSYGMVDLPSGKMKSREGTVVDADDLIEEMVQEARKTGEQLSKLDDFSDEEKTHLFEMIGLAALKYFLLKVDPKKRMLFDPAASIDLHGHTGPFIQYTYARIRSLLRKAGAIVRGPGDRRIDAPLLPEERAVIKLLHQLPAVLNEAAQRLDPSVARQPHLRTGEGLQHLLPEHAGAEGRGCGEARFPPCAERGRWQRRRRRPCGAWGSRCRSGCE